ncbi:MAG TPA: FAD-dependent monooxygenase [Longimicrobium sp.]|jgi:2-polyprenyl-6-methoxyphenol hydroxylase-like FAD-dependent oxidoreductase
MVTAQPSGSSSGRGPGLDVLVVGAGPTGLALAAQLRRFGARFRIVDRVTDRTNESRALAVQARTLELLQSLGLGDTLAARGTPGSRARIHFDGRLAAEIRLGGFAAKNTRYPFVLFISQAETEAVLIDHLTAEGIVIERGVELVELEDGGDEVRCVLRHGDGREERIAAAYLAGCDGAHSTVRKKTGIPYEGDRYPQEFALGDVEADGPLEPGVIHAFSRDGGIAMLFPLGHPRGWRVIGMRPPGAAADADAPDPPDLTLDELQAIVDRATGGGVRLRDPAWMTEFRLHHRQAARYRAGRVFLAGDAAHIHSPVGGQGMNTGVQDAWNLGWKLALVARGAADARLVDSYQAERWPVGRFLLRNTDRAFGFVARLNTSGGLAAWFRRTVVARVIRWAGSSARLRAYAFRFVSQLAIRYRRSPAVAEGGPRLRAGPRAGDRLPDAPVTRDGRATFLQAELAGPRLHLLLCGPVAAWDSQRLADLTARHGNLLAVRHLTRSPTAGALVDAGGDVLAMLGVKDTAQYLVRPDGYIAYRCAGTDFTGVVEYLAEWFPPASDRSA